MRLLLTLTIISSLLLTVGCSLHQVKGEIGGVEIEAKTKDSDDKFCPPGQAKKGKC